MLAFRSSVNEGGRNGAFAMTGSRVVSTIVLSSSVKVKASTEVVMSSIESQASKSKRTDAADAHEPRCVR
jgi:hypothetical protein